MAENGQNQYITRRELDLRLKNIEQISTRIEETIADVAKDLKEFKSILNPAFAILKQDLAGHIEQNERETQRRRDKWSPLQLAITAIVAAAAIGMFIVSILK